LANLSLRQLATLAEVSNPYLSQVERGMHAPSLRVIQSIAHALDVSAETLLRQAGLADDDADGPAADTEAVIRNDPRLTHPQRLALLSVYRSYLEANSNESPDGE
jgi:transcriptional regulator with XRE-family HTH domain